MKYQPQIPPPDSSSKWLLTIAIAALIAIGVIHSITAKAQVTQKEVREAKMKYINAKKKMLTDTSAITREMMQMDSLYYEGLRAIRHDQMIPAFLRK